MKVFTEIDIKEQYPNQVWGLEHNVTSTPVVDIELLRIKNYH